MPVRLKRRLLTVEEYHRMGEVGILQEKGLELIKGEIIEMSPIGSKHAALVEKLKTQLLIALHGKVNVRVQNPIIIGDFSEPEPDIAVVKFRPDYYAESHPKAEDTFLVIEVADSSLEYDQEIKLPLYASAGVPEVWILDFSNQKIEVYHSPFSDSYQSKKILRLNDEVSAQKIDFQSTVSDLFI